MENLKQKNAKSIFKEILIGKWSFFWKIPGIFYLVVYTIGFFLKFMIGVGFVFLQSSRFKWLQSYVGLPEQWDFLIQEYRNIFFETGIYLLVHQLLYLIVVLLFIFIVDRYTRDDIGLAFDLKSVFLVFGGILSAAFVLSLFILVLFTTGNFEYNGFVRGDEFIVGNLQSMLTIQASIFIVVSFQEELLARAYFLNILKGIGRFGSVIVSSIIFALLHLGNIGVTIEKGFWETVLEFFLLRLTIDSYLGIFNIFILASLFALYFIYFKDLWFLIGAHFMWNFYMGSIWGMTVSNIESLKGSVIDTQLTGSVLMTGGGFGPEGSIIITAILGIIMLFVIRKIRKVSKNEIATD